MASLNKLYKLWKTKIDGPETNQPLKNALRFLDKADPKEVRSNIKVKVCAVWDTIGSLGFPAPDPFPQKYSKRLAHVNSRLCANIEVAIQALALNERRKHFQPTVWEVNPLATNQILKQCWFLGTHSDVGGGNQDTGLANITLVWMIAQLEKYVGFDLEALDRFKPRSTIASTDVSTEFGLSMRPASGNKQTISARVVGFSPRTSEGRKIVTRTSSALTSHGILLLTPPPSEPSQSIWG